MPKEINAESWEKLTNLEKIEKDKERAYKFFHDNNYTIDQIGLNVQEHSEIIRDIFDYFKGDKNYRKQFNKNLDIGEWEKLYKDEWEKLPTYEAKLEFDEGYTEFQLNTAKLERDVKGIYNILGQDKAFEYFKEKGYGENELASFNSYTGVGQDEYKTIKAVLGKELFSYIQLYSTEEKQKGGKGISAHWTGQGADRLGFANALVSFKLEPGISEVSKKESFEVKTSNGKVTQTNLGDLMQRSERGRKGLDIEIEKMKRVETQKKRRQLSDDKPEISKKASM